MKNTIKLNGKKFELISHSFRADWLFEAMAGKTVEEAKGTRDNMMYIYCLFQARNKDFEYSFDEFVDIIDDNQEIMKEIYLLLGYTEKKQ
jgi:hypothetical protein